jgi:glycine/D-amino acid oxidase-like deaminating enzyme
MDLKSGYPFWAVKNGLMKAFPRLEGSLSCDVVVVGAGITGALVARELAENGHEVVVVDERDVGWGSTAASTALLQYEIDTHMVDLAKRYGEDNAVLAYRGCLEGIDVVQAASHQARGVEFKRMKSLYYASSKPDAAALKDEYELRKTHGFRVKWLDTAKLSATYGLAAPGAILSLDAARVDPYRLAHKILGRLKAHGTSLFVRTKVTRIQARANGVTLGLADVGTIRAKYVVLAAGYQSQQWLKQKVAFNHSSYAWVSAPIATEQLGYLRTTMLWESARPYLYLRSTGDNRLVVGGEDDEVDNPTLRDQRVVSKAKLLHKRVTRLLGELHLVPAFSWAGTFAETADGLPYFGAHDEWGPRVLFAMAYGGNGITFSAIGAGIIRAAIEKKRHPLTALYSFARTKA